MPRLPRTAVSRSIVHVVNRGNDRRRLFAFRGDYEAFLGILSSTQRREGLQLLGYVVMPNHWHLVAWPESVPQLSRFMQRVTSAHAAIVRTHSHSIGQGHVYQGRYHATVVSDDEQLRRTLRYVEANPVRAGLVGRAEFWRWSSLDERLGSPRLIVDPPVPLPPVATWLDLVNAPTSEQALPGRPRRPRLGMAVALDPAASDGDPRDGDRPRYK
ncbi:MAG: transposase [Acidobacteria bacterium]|nr:transposase [Acidobacteriota bacterium]